MRLITFEDNDYLTMCITKTPYILPKLKSQLVFRVKTLSTPKRTE